MRHPVNRFKVLIRREAYRASYLNAPGSIPVAEGRRGTKGRLWLGRGAAGLGHSWRLAV